MLYVPKQSAQFFTYDNWGANPSATPGTSIVPGASNVQGSWTQVASSANIAQDVYGVYVQALGGATSAASKQQLFDLGVDNAGGTSYTAIIQDFACGDSPALTNPGNQEYFFPIFIKAGSSVAIRVRGANATAGTVRFAVKFYGYRSKPEVFPVGMFAETLGADTATSKGTSFTPGNAADGSWVDMGATSKDMWWWQLGYQIDNATITVEYTYIDLAYGDATNKINIFRIMHGGSTSETVGKAMQTNLLTPAAYCPVPAGTHIYIRGRTNNAPDTGYNATVTGIGG